MSTARLSVLFSIFLLSACSAFSDTIIVKDGREIKGIIVEDYNDRVVISTVDGEMKVMKADIRELSYDSEEDNLVKLGDQARDAGNYQKSYGYYQMAYKKNPQSKSAKEGLALVQGYLFRKEEAKKEAILKLHSDYEAGRRVNELPQSDEADIKERQDKLRRATGMSLELRNTFPDVSNIQFGSPAYTAGVRKGDRIVAIWGKLTGYLSLEEVLDILTRKMSLEARCTIERDVDVGINEVNRLFAGTDKLIGAGFSMEFSGLTISKVIEDGPVFTAGLNKGDLVTAIDGQSTRYMPIKKVVSYIRSAKRNVIRFTIRRDIVIWWKGNS